MLHGFLKSHRELCAGLIPETASMDAAIHFFKFSGEPRHPRVLDARVFNIFEAIGIK